MRRRARYLAGAGLGAALILAGLLPLKERLIWNRTASAPLGLYWLSDRLPAPGEWAVVSARAPEAQWASERGYTGPDWPQIKQVAATSGAEICRQNLTVSVAGEVMAEALENGARGEFLPVWHGCRRLKAGEIFLINPHPRSLDGRYFGATKMDDLAGTALPVRVESAR